MSLNPGMLNKIWCLLGILHFCPNYWRHFLVGIAGGHLKNITLQKYFSLYTEKGIEWDSSTSCRENQYVTIEYKTWNLSKFTELRFVHHKAQYWSLCYLPNVIPLLYDTYLYVYIYIIRFRSNYIITVRRRIKATIWTKCPNTHVDTFKKLTSSKSVSIWRRQRDKRRTLYSFD